MVGCVVQEVMVVDASEGQIFLATYEGDETTNLYISESQGVRFSLSLRNIVFYNPEGANADSFVRFLDIVFFPINRRTRKCTVARVCEQTTLEQSVRRPSPRGRHARRVHRVGAAQRHVQHGRADDDDHVRQGRQLAVPRRQSHLSGFRILSVVLLLQLGCFYRRLTRTARDTERAATCTRPTTATSM